MLGIGLAMFLGALDQTIVATALPRIVEDLQGLSRYAWVTTAYLLASTVLVPIYGKLADMFSRKAIVLFAVITFLLGSVLCGAAGEFGTLPLLGDGMNQLILFRALQGIGGAGLFALAFIVVADLYPPRERGRYQGIFGAVFAIASVVGPWIGGLLTDHGDAFITGIEGWRWVFYVNLPLGALALWFIVSRMPALRPAAGAQRLDMISATLLLASLVPLVLGLQLDKTAYPWGGVVTVGLLATALVMGTLFAWRSLRTRNPILDLRLFRDAVFSRANLAGFLLGGAFMPMIVFLPLFMVNVVGVSATSAGLSLIPLSLGVSLSSITAGQLVARFGRYKPFIVFGAAMLVLAVILLATMPADIPAYRVSLYMIIAGMGIGPGLPLLTLAIQNAVPGDRVGQATSAAQFFRQIGGLVVISIVGSVLTVSLSQGFRGLAGGMPGLEQPGAVLSEVDPRGVGAITEGVRAAMEAGFEAVADALRAGEPEALQAALEQSALPAAARLGITVAAAGVRGDPAATEALVGELRGQFEPLRDQVLGELSEQVRHTFADAVRDVFRSLVVVTLLGLVATLFVPQRELRTGAGQAAPAPVD